MERLSRSLSFPALASLLVLASGVACHGGGSHEPSSGANTELIALRTASVAAGTATGDLPVPTNTILADTAGVMPPTGDGSLSVGDRGEVRQHIPIWVPPGRAGMQPQLSLEYSSGGGNGLVGTGWALAGLPRITRCNNLRQNGNVAPPILWYWGDGFCLDGEELVTNQDHYFYQKFHDDGSRLFHFVGQAADGVLPPDYFVLESKDGRILTFGGTPDSHVIVTSALPAPGAVLTWALSRVEDRAGNFMTVSYEPGRGGDIVPNEIDYTGSKSDATTHRSVTFVYDWTRPDVDQKVVAGQTLTYPARLVGLQMNAPNSAGLTPLRSFSLNYSIGPTTGRSLLTNVAECDGPAPPSLPVTGSTPLCRQESFTYAPGVPLAAGNSFGIYGVDSTGAAITDLAEGIVDGVGPWIRFLDVDADGRDDILYLSTDPNELYYLRLSTGTAFGPAIKTDIPVAVPINLPTPVFGTSPPIVLDFDGDGHDDVLVNQGPSSAPVAHLYLANAQQGYWTLGGADFEGPLWSTYDNYQSADLNGDGRPDLVMMQGTVAYYSLNTNGLFSGLTTPTPLPTQTNTDYADALTNYFLDFNNDGITDIMTRTWADNACVGNRLGDLNCDCKKMGYGALDVGANLYSGYPGGAGLTTTGVYGLDFCTGAFDQISYHTPLFGDFNGDGVVDVIQTWVPDDGSTDPPMNLKLSLGTGNQEFIAQTGGSFTLPNPGLVTFETIDANLDGKTDLLVRTGANDPYTVYSWQNQTWQPTPLVIGEDPGYYTATQQLFASGDVNGDGLPDFVAYSGNGSNLVGQLVLYLRQAQGPQPDLLTGVQGDFGPTATVSYEPYLAASNPPEDRSDCHIPMVCVARAGWLASEVDVDNGIGGTNARHHTFASGRADALGWGSLGFKKHTIVDDTTGAVTTRTFDFSLITGGATPFYPFVGLPREVDTTTVYQSAGQPVTRTSTTSTTYIVQGTGPFMALPSVTESVTTDSNVSTPIASMTAQRAFDPYGSVTSETDFWPIDSETRTTTTTYLNDTSNWIIGRPTYVSTTSTTASGDSATRVVAYTYDSLGQLAVQIDNPGAASGGSYDPLPTQTDGVQTLYTRYGRDPNGMPTRIVKTDNLTAPTTSRTTLLQYDATEGMYVVQKTDPANLVTRTAYEPGLGVRAAETDAAGVLTTYQVDTFGRIRADHPTAGGDRSVNYYAAPAGNFGSIDDHRLGQYDVTKTLDSLHRTVATTKTGRADGQPVSTETTYDALGRAYVTTRPHFPGVPTAQTVTTYDNLGRVTLVTGADGSTQSTAYLGRQTTTTNADGNLSSVTSDSLGRPVTSVQATTSGAGGLQGHVTTTTLTYGSFGTLYQSTDTLGNVVRTIYDRLGRPHIKIDRDTGATGYKYDVYGDQTDEIRGARLLFLFFGGHVTLVVSGGVDTATTYDGDGRILTKTAPDVGQTYTWDTVYPGKLSSQTITGGTSIAYTYDGFGNVQTKTWNGPRGAIGYAYTYDQYNRLSMTTYPALPAASNQPALVVQNTYSGGDVGGELVGVSDVTDPTSPTAYWTLKSTDASEQFPVTDLQNGVETTLGEDPAHPGWLNTITSKVGTTTIQSLTYGREGAGRVRERDDAVNGTTETFYYDGLERLVAWNWNGAAGARGVEYVYDDIGNLQTRSVTAGPGASVTYTYNASAAYGPHQVSGDSSGTAFTYDPQGRQTVGPGRSFAFNSFDRPTSVTASSGQYTMTYDADVARFSRTDPAGNVRYSYGGLFDEFSDSAGTHYLMKILADGHPVTSVEKIVNGGGLRTTMVNTILVDALGSIDALVGPNGRPQAVKYDPFGARVQTSDPTVDVTTPPRDLRAGFTGHDHDDDVDLIDMVGRVYDPVQQRFLSVDPPPPTPTDSQAYNPYSYVRNNPLNATDPTGYLEVLMEGVPFGTSPEDAYTQPAGWQTVSGPSPFNEGPGTSQGVSGTDGPGNYSLGNYAGQLKVDPTLLLPTPPVDELQMPPVIAAPPGYAPPGTTGFSVGSPGQLDPLNTVFGGNPERNELWLRAETTLAWMFGGTGRPSPQQIAWLTNQIWNNTYLGTCAPAAGMNAALGLMNLYGGRVDVMWGTVWDDKAEWLPGVGRYRDKAHAVAVLTDSATEYTLTWGGTRYPNEQAVSAALGYEPYNLLKDVRGPEYPHWRDSSDGLMTPNWGP
jgi:RHS repeat-associated protein